jgi:hypothetical protein
VSNHKAFLFVRIHLNTSMASFLSNTLFLTMYDQRMVGQLCSDSGTAVSPSNLPTDPNLTQALLIATGEVCAAVLQGGMYQLTDLESLTDFGLAYLQSLVGDLALYRLVLRRGKNVEDYPQTAKALEQLDLIKSGERVFFVSSNIAAGVMSSPPVTRQTIAEQNYIRNATRQFPVPRYTIWQS